MSFNQSRSDKSEYDNQYKKSGRSASFNQQRGSTGTHSKTGGAGGSGPSPSINSNRSFKKSAQGGQSRAGVPNINSSDSSNPTTTPRGLQNGSHLHPQLHGASNAPLASTAAKSTESSAVQRSPRAVPKAPTSQSASMNSDPPPPETPSKTGDQSKAFAFQFGSISPGFMDVMQIPARTSSAPPNLDEQKRDQAWHNFSRPVAPVPVPSAPKPQLQRKDAVPVDQPNNGEAHAVTKAKKDMHASPATPPNQIHKPSVLPMTGTSMPVSFHQSMVSVPFGGSNQQIKPQGVTPSSLQMPRPMQLPMGSAPQVQQPLFIPALQSHSMQPPVIMHQSQGLAFTPQMGTQLPQMGNMGINVAPQYPQQQGGKFGGARKPAVRITDPKTHEELRFDNKHKDTASSGSKPNSSIPPQSQPTPAYAPPHPINYYPNSYNPTPLFYPNPSSLPLTSGQMAPNSQVPRFNYPVSQGTQNVSFMNPSSLGSLPVNKSGTMHGITDPHNLEQARNALSIKSSAPTAAVQVTIKPPTGYVGEKVTDSVPNSLSRVEKDESHRTSRSSGEVNLSSSQRDFDISSENFLPNSRPDIMTTILGESVAVSTGGRVSSPMPSTSASPSLESELVTESVGGRRDPLYRPDSIKDHQTKPGKKGHIQQQHKVTGPSTSTLGQPVQEPGISSQGEVSETAEPKTSLSPVIREGESEPIESPSSVNAPTSDASKSTANKLEGISCSLSEIPGAGIVLETSEPSLQTQQDDQLKTKTLGTEQQGEEKLSKWRTGDLKGSENIPEPSLSNSLYSSEQTDQESAMKSTNDSTEVSTLEATQKGLDEPVSCHAEVDGIADNVDGSTSTYLKVKDVESFDGDKLSLDASSNRRDNTEVIVTKRGGSEHQSAVVQASELSEGKHEGESVDVAGGGGVSHGSGYKDKSLTEINRVKNISSKGKKKRKEILQKADAAGTTSDLYMAYKGPEEKRETIIGPKDISTSVDSGQVSAEEAFKEDAFQGEKDAQNKDEPADWEDAADISSPKLETSHNGELGRGENGNMANRYSRDFLLKFSEQFTDLPQGFEITQDIEAWVNTPRTDRPPSGGSRVDRHGSIVIDEGKWSKQPGQSISGWDRLDLAYGAANAGFRPQGGSNHGVARNPRAQTPQHVGGILPGPMHSSSSQGGLQRNNSDAERWQRATNFQQKGLIPSPHTPPPIMHKAEKRYEVGKVTDEEEAKQRQLKAILNKLTPQNFEKLFEQVKAVNIDNVNTLIGVISQIFDKALMEPTFCEMYANFCSHLAVGLPDFNVDNEKITFKRFLLNKCQEEFERGEREEEEANKAEEEGEVKQSAEEREEKRIKARRRMLGNIRLIGELYKKKMLTEKIMHECIKKLLGQYQNPDEENIEALCKLISTIGEMIDHARAKEHMDAYFEMMAQLSNNMKLSSRVRFMLKDAIDLRRNKWQQRRKVEGPKKIDEVHRDAAQERQAQASRLARGPGINPSPRRGPSTDFGPRGSAMLSSPGSAQMGGFRGYPNQVRGYGGQDARLEVRQSYENRTFSVPLPQRSISDDTITLGPQGGLARGMSIRGPQTIPSTSPLAEVPPGAGDTRRMTAASNGYSSVPERANYNTREGPNPRYMPDRYGGPASFDQSNAQERNISYGHNNRDLRSSDPIYDRSLSTPPNTQGQVSTLTPNVPSDKLLSEDHLQDKSIATIKEYYSARDKKEVALCIKDLNSPSFHPSMISLWITDSFERKDLERDLLVELLVNLSKSGDCIFSHAQLVKGFEFVLATLEDAVNDAPKAPQFMGRIFAKIILEDVISLREIGQLIYQGGEEPGCLLKAGLAADVLGNILEVIRSEKGESVLNEIRTSSNLRLEMYRPPEPMKSRILENFI